MLVYIGQDDGESAKLARARALISLIGWQGGDARPSATLQALRDSLAGTELFSRFPGNSPLGLSLLLSSVDSAPRGDGSAVASVLVLLPEVKMATFSAAKDLVTGWCLFGLALLVGIWRIAVTLVPSSPPPPPGLGPSSFRSFFYAPFPAFYVVSAFGCGEDWEIDRRPLCVYLEVSPIGFSGA